jgi:hypothetical protein
MNKCAVIRKILAFIGNLGYSNVKSTKTVVTSGKYNFFSMLLQSILHLDHKFYQV